MSEFETESPGDAERPPKEGPGAFGRFLALRVPLWALLAVTVAVAAIMAVMMVIQQQSAIDLNPVVGAAEEIDMEVTVCNHEVDRLELNPRAAELDLEDLFTDQGAGAADVRVERRDCPRPPQP